MHATTAELIAYRLGDVFRAKNVVVLVNDIKPSVYFEISTEYKSIRGYARCFGPTEFIIESAIRHAQDLMASR